MKYIEPFTFFVKKENGFKNLMFATVCVFIPIMGAIVLLGYRAEMAEDLDKDPDLKDYPDFTFDRFMEYFNRGIWPFVMQLIVSLVLSVFVFVVIGIGFAVGALTKEPAIGIAAGAILLIPLTLLSMLIIWPLELHAQLTRNFEFGNACGFAYRLVSKVWGQALMAALAYWFIGMFLAMLGYLACFIGVYPVVVALSMAQQHFSAQLYRLYLDEGGEPIYGARDRMERDEQ